MELHGNAYWSIDHRPDQGVVSIVWTDKTASMGDEDFKHALELLARFAAEHAASGILVDVREFRHSVGAELGEWRAKTVVPQYNGAGVRRFAYVTGPGGPPARAPAKLADGEDFLTGFFTSDAEALAWLAGD